MKLDHIAISGANLADAQTYVETTLGVALQAGGEHDVFHTHNALIALDEGLYLEAIAINPKAPKPARPRWFDLDRFEGSPRLTNWICRSDDLGHTLNEIPLELGQPVNLQRAALKWSMAVPDNGLLPFDNCAPAVIQWHTASHPAQTLAASGCRLRRLTIRHPEAEALNAALDDHFDDDRVSFETGSVGMAAEFDTPHGPRVMGG